MNKIYVASTKKNGKHYVKGVNWKTKGTEKNYLILTREPVFAIKFENKFAFNRFRVNEIKELRDNIENINKAIASFTDVNNTLPNTITVEILHKLKSILNYAVIKIERNNMEYLDYTQAYKIKDYKYNTKEKVEKFINEELIPEHKNTINNLLNQIEYIKTNLFFTEINDISFKCKEKVKRNVEFKDVDIGEEYCIICGYNIPCEMLRIDYYSHICPFCVEKIAQKNQENMKKLDPSLKKKYDECRFLDNIK